MLILPKEEDEIWNYKKNIAKIMVLILILLKYNETKYKNHFKLFEFENLKVNWKIILIIIKNNFWWNVLRRVIKMCY